MPSLREAEVDRLRLKIRRNRREKRYADSPGIPPAAHCSRYDGFDVFRCPNLVYRGATGPSFKAMFLRTVVSSRSPAAPRGSHCTFPLAGRCNPMPIRCRSCETENPANSSPATPCVANSPRHSLSRNQRRCVAEPMQLSRRSPSEWRTCTPSRRTPDLWFRRN